MTQMANLLFLKTYHTKLKAGIGTVLNCNMYSFLYTYNNKTAANQRVFSKKIYQKIGPNLHTNF